MKILTDAELLGFAGYQESAYIVAPSEYAANVLDRLEGKHTYQGGRLPWKKTHEDIRLRAGEVTMWAGISGHRKSTITSQVAAWLAVDDPVLIASLEMPVPSTVAMLVRQVAGTEQVTRAFAQRIMDWFGSKLWLYDQTHAMAPKRIYGLIHYAGVELKCRHIFIDSLMKCGISEDGPRAQTEQKDFINGITQLAKESGIHVHLIHHMRKGQDEATMPDKFDVRGSGRLVDYLDNLIICHRNVKKERKAEAGEAVNEGDPDIFVRVAKQRHGEWEGTYGLYTHDSQQITSAPGIAERHPIKAPSLGAGERGKHRVGDFPQRNELEQLYGASN